VCKGFRHPANFVSVEAGRDRPLRWARSFVTHAKNSNTAPIGDAAAIAVDAEFARR